MPSIFFKAFYYYDYHGIIIWCLKCFWDNFMPWLIVSRHFFYVLTLLWWLLLSWCHNISAAKLKLVYHLIKYGLCPSFWLKLFGGHFDLNPIVGLVRFWPKLMRTRLMKKVFLCEDVIKCGYFDHNLYWFLPISGCSCFGFDQ